MGRFKTKVERFRHQEKGGRNRSGSGFDRNYHRLSWLFWIILLAGCSSLKKSAVVTTAAGTGAAVATAISGGVAAPIVGAMTGAFVGDVTTEVLSNPETTDCCSLGFWDLLERLVDVGGWFLIIVFIAPMVLGWLLPGPLERKHRD
jgi:hypothetical protein